MSSEGITSFYSQLTVCILNKHFHFIEIVDVSISEDNECTSSACHTEIAQLKQQICGSEKRIQDAKKKYHELLVQNLKKDILINQLEENMKQYNEFRGVISDTAIDVLSSIDNSKSKDLFFISTAVKDLYQKELPKLKQRTYSGQKRTTAKISKDAITPEKKNVLKELFRQRMKNDPDSENRMKIFATHVKQAIESINDNKTNK